MYINVNQYTDCACDADMIQAALDVAVQTGQSVLIPKINARTGKDVWDITHTIFLHDESVVLLQNCCLRLADGALCNIFSNKNARTSIAMTQEGKQKNITIRGIGKAILDGGVHNGIYEENGIARATAAPHGKDTSLNCMLYFQMVENLVIDNITIKNQRYWGVALYTTTYSRVSNIRFESDSNVPCQDGVDLLKGCHDCIVENITGCVGDNAVAILAADSVYNQVVSSVREGDIYNIIVRNLMVYGVAGCALVRILNHDGYKIYNVFIDNIIETSPWSTTDASLAPNADLNIVSDEDGRVYAKRLLVPGEEGYRCEAAVIIGESYWYEKTKAAHGDTYGIHISNVMTHARYAIFLNNTLLDSSFDNIRLFGNGFMAAYFGAGQYENVRFNHIYYDKDARPLTADAHIYVDWNQTKSDGFSCIYANGAQLKNVCVQDLHCADGMESVFGGFGSGNIMCGALEHAQVPALSTMQGIDLIGE